MSVIKIYTCHECDIDYDPPEFSDDDIIVMAGYHPEGERCPTCRTCEYCGEVGGSVALRSNGIRACKKCAWKICNECGEYHESTAQDAQRQRYCPECYDQCARRICPNCFTAFTGEKCPECVDPPVNVSCWLGHEIPKDEWVKTSDGAWKAMCHCNESIRIGVVK